jgi:serine/threonine protein kinase
MAGEPSQIGPYQVGKRIGQGGMGAVYEAVHETIGRRAAVKFLNAPLARNPATLNRFFNEARAVSVVEHPGLVQIYDSGQLPDGPAYIIMELIRGETLSERLKRERCLPVSQALRLGWQLADTLAAVHEKEIVHRDIKPANLMIVPDPAATGRERLKVLDFGIAKLASGIGAGETRPGQVLGSPVYMAPEQCRGAAGVDTKADVYAAGAVLYHMLAGQPPFEGETFAALVFKHLHEPLVPLTEHGVEAPSALIDCVHSLLRKDPKQRPTMRDTAARLESLLAEVEKQAGSSAPSRVPVKPASAAVDSPTDTTRIGSDLASTLGQSVGQSRITRWPPPRSLIGGLMASAVVVAALLALVWPKGAEETSPSKREDGKPSTLASGSAAGVGQATGGERTDPLPTARALRPAGKPTVEDGGSPSALAAAAAPESSAETRAPASKPAIAGAASSGKSGAAKTGPASNPKRRPAASKGNKSLATKRAFPIIQ